MTQEIPSEANWADMELENNSAVQNGTMVMGTYAKLDISVKVGEIRSKPAV